MSKWFAAVGILLCVSASAAFALDDGDYNIVEGRAANGGTYGGNVVIRKVGDFYSLKWLIAKSGEQYAGIGILRDGILSVAWGTGANPGVVSYRVVGNSLDGTWADGSGPKLGVERLEKKR